MHVCMDVTLGLIPLGWWCSFELSWPCGIGWMGQSSRMQDAGSLEVAIERLLTMYGVLSYVLWEDPRKRSLTCVVYVVMYLGYSGTTIGCSFGGCVGMACADRDYSLLALAMKRGWIMGEADDHHLWTVQYTEYIL
jgi:hypothetical protein